MTKRLVVSVRRIAPVYARDDRPFGGSDPPMVAYRFEDGRGGDQPK